MWGKKQLCVCGRFSSLLPVGKRKEELGKGHVELGGSKFDIWRNEGNRGGGNEVFVRERIWGLWQRGN